VDNSSPNDDRSAINSATVSGSDSGFSASAHGEDTPSTSNISSRSSLGAAVPSASDLEDSNSDNRVSGISSGAQRYRNRRHKQKSRRLGFSAAEQERIRRYLEAYRDGADHVCFSDHDESEGCDGPSIVGIVPDWCRSKGVIIAGHSFLALREEVLLQPFLSLPATLSSKERKFVHSLCVDGRLVGRLLFLSFLNNTES